MTKPKSKYADRHFIILRNDDLTQLELEADALVKQGFDPFSLNENEQVDGSTLYILPMCRQPDEDPGMVDLMEAPGDHIITPANVHAIVQDAVQAEMQRGVEVLSARLGIQLPPGGDPLGLLPETFDVVQDRVLDGVMPPEDVITGADLDLCIECARMALPGFRDSPHVRSGVEQLINKLARIRLMI